MSAISPVNRIPSAGTDERPSTQPSVSLADRMAEAGAAPPKKKKPSGAEVALPAATVPLALRPAQTSLTWGVGGAPVAAAHTGAPGASVQQVPMHLAAVEPSSTAVHAGAPVAPVRQSSLHPILAGASAGTDVSGGTETSERRTAPVAPATPLSDTSPARGSAVTPASTTIAQPPVVPVPAAEAIAVRRDHAEPASAPVAVPSELAVPGRPSLPMPSAPVPSAAALPSAPAAPAPSLPAPPAAPAPSMTVAFQSWGLGHQVHARWVPAGVVLTPSSDRVGQALTSATLEGSAATEGELWRVEQVDADREQRRQRLYVEPERETP
ncbi:hypothetical protein [Pseudoxanthomonas sp. UTMC 1351]|uniref:SpaN/EivJ family type III secretion system needle length determinant n=1 Tax=Pseudoxanthomonas sp. UTMC 1351 TaxID=2695853 RepID=UPI0034CE61CB